MQHVKRSCISIGTNNIHLPVPLETLRDFQSGNRLSGPLLYTVYPILQRQSVAGHTGIGIREKRDK